MELFIRLQHGQPFEHPILGDNFRQAFPEVDVNNLPDWAARFVRVEPPQPGIYEIYEGVTYEWSGDIVTDVHHIRPMSNEEKLEKQNKTKELWSQVGFVSWVFDETTCSFVPPVAYPKDGKVYVWDEDALSWVEHVRSDA